MASLNWRPDLYRHHKCEACGVQAATVGTLCAACDHERWQQERNGTQAPKYSPPVVQWMGGKDGQYVQISGTPVPEYVQLADYQRQQEQRCASQEARELYEYASGR
jgi:hypothetical protein